MANTNLLLGTLRINATIPRKLHDKLIQRADYEGRSLSNLIAFLLEAAMLPYELPKL